MIVWFRFVLCVCFLPTSFVVVDLAFSLAPTVAVAVSQMRDQIRHRGPYLTCPLRHITCLAFYRDTGSSHSSLVNSRRTVPAHTVLGALGSCHHLRIKTSIRTIQPKTWESTTRQRGATGGRLPVLPAALRMPCKPCTLYVMPTGIRTR